MADKDERQRGLNQVWAGAEAYDFTPLFVAFDRAGNADLYLNLIIGAVHRLYDPQRIGGLFGSLETSVSRVTLDALLWLGLENCAYGRELPARPALYGLRRGFAGEYLARPQTAAEERMEDVLQTARCCEILGRKFPFMTIRQKRLYRRLCFDPSLDTDGIVREALEIFREYYHFRPIPARAGLLQLRGLAARLAGLFVRPDVEMKANTPESALSAPGKGGGAAARTGSLRLGGPGYEKRLRQNLDYVRQNYGAPLFGAHETAVLTARFCCGIHEGSRLYYTCVPPKDAQLQRPRNLSYYRSHAAACKNSISALTRQLQSILTGSVTVDSIPARTGSLVGGIVWRRIYLDDLNIFLKAQTEEAGDFSVDLLLDASASRMNSQEVIAAQAYILAESMTRCHIPVQVSAFRTVRGVTVISRFRSYGEAGRNAEVFNYCSSGWNRDGLALRGISRLMEASPFRSRILLVLTDASPNDDMPAATGRLFARDYSGPAGVADTAAAVRFLRGQGIRVVGIFTGQQTDVPAARQIFGDDCIRLREVSRMPQVVSCFTGMPIRAQDGGE